MQRHGSRMPKCFAEKVSCVYGAAQANTESTTFLSQLIQYHLQLVLDSFDL